MNGRHVAGDRRRRSRTALLIICLSFGAVLAPSAGATSRSSAQLAVAERTGDWPVFHGSANRAGVNRSEQQIDLATAPTLGLKWSYATGGPIWSSPVIANGVAYFGSDDKSVYAIDASTGALKWSFPTGDMVRTSPAVVGGVAYVGSNDDKVYALDAATGAKIWDFATGGDLLVTSPLVADGKVYIGSTDGNFYALDQATGAKKWSVKTWAVRGAAAFWNDTVYVGSDKSVLWALNANTGETRWSATTGGFIRNTPAVVGGVVYTGADDGRVYAYDARTGTFKWKTTVLPGCAIVRSAPAIFNGKVYVDTGETCPMVGHFYVFDASTGTQICNHEMADYATSSVAIAGGVALVGSFSHQLYAFDASNCNKLWDSGFTVMEGGIPSSPAVSRGVVYVGSLDNSLYAFTPGREPLSSFISIGDNFFDPSEVIGHDIGTGAEWTNDGSNSHDVTDTSGMSLFASGTIAPGGTYTFTFVGAGIYKYNCTIHPSMTGTVKAPMILTPSTGTLTTVFTIEWGTAPPPNGFVYDVQIRRPGSSDFVDWITGTALPAATFVADDGTGTYDFKAHVKNLSNGKSADYSPFKTITVS